MQDATVNSRIDGLDVARGIALIAMASYHFSWDLELFGYLEAGTASSGFLKLYARCIASTFLFIVGFSLVLATVNGVKWRRFMLRIAQVGLAAALISGATYFAMPNGWIFFGILHHIVIVSLIGLLFLPFKWPVAALAALAAFALPQLGVVTTNGAWLSFLGFFKSPPNSNDFVPLFPWLSASLAGIAAAKLAVANGFIDRLAKPKADLAPARQLKFLGRHSLAFYLLHQLVLIGLVWVAAQIMPPLAQPGQNSGSAAFQLECLNVCGQRFDANQCEVYCTCFENELASGASQLSQLPVEDQSAAIGDKCSQKMQETLSP